jgi:hypothetical protein
MTKISSFVNVLIDLDEEVLDDIVNTVPGKKNTSKKSGSDKSNNFDPFGELENNKSSKNPSSDEMTLKEKEKILRAFVENAVNIPAVAREQGTTIEEFEFWDEMNMSKELFFNVYNTSWTFKDRIDAIYSLCSDEQYLIENYISRVSI